MKGRQGVTLIELLVTVGILSLLLAALTGLFTSTSRAYQANSRSSEVQQNLEAATQLLKYEIGLAGYRGIDSGMTQRSFSGQPTFQVTTGANASTPDSVTVRFYEDRYVPGSQPVLRTITFTINGGQELTRQEVNGTAQAIATGIRNFKVAQYVLQDGSRVTTAPTNRMTLVGVTLRLELVSGPSRTITIALHNPQG